MPRVTRLLIATTAAVIASAIGAFALYYQKDIQGAEIPVATAQRVPTLEKPVAEANDTEPGGRVLVRSSIAEMRADFLRVKGKTEASRSVSVSSKARGAVEKAEVEQGQLVAQGDVLCALEKSATQVKLDEAKAALTAARLEHEKMVGLVEKGWKLPRDEDETRAELEGARATVRAIELEMANTQIVAPIDGLFETRIAQVGDFLSPGDPCGMVIDLDPLLAVIEVDETEAALIDQGARALVRIGESDPTSDIESVVQFVASSKSPDSGLYRIEIAMENSELLLRADQTAEVRIEIGRALAHLVNPGAVVLADAGRLQVRHVGVDSKIKLSDVEIVDRQKNAVWVTGLPEEALLLVEGQGELSEGLRVDPVLDENVSADRSDSSG